MPETHPPPGPLLRGDPRAFDRLYADLAPRVLGYLSRLTGRRASANENPPAVPVFTLVHAGCAETHAGYAPYPAHPARGLDPRGAAR